MIRIVVGNQKYDVPERVGRIIVWLIAHADRLTKMERVKLTFNCAGNKICTEMVEGGEA